MYDKIELRYFAAVVGPKQCAECCDRFTMLAG